MFGYGFRILGSHECSREKRLNLNAVQTAQGLVPLCPSCFRKEDCPHFKGSSHPEWEDTLAQLIKLKNTEKVA